MFAEHKIILLWPYIVSMAETSFKNIGAIILSMTFRSLEVARPCREYSSHVWVGAPSCYLDMLDKLQKRVFSLLSLLNPWVIIEMYPDQVFSIGVTWVDVHLNWLNWFRVLILVGEPLIILVGWRNFLSRFPGVMRMSTSVASFLGQLDSGMFCL